MEQQELVPGFAPPSLVEAWDIWPLLGSGAAGFEVREDRLVVGTRFPLREGVKGLRERVSKDSTRGTQAPERDWGSLRIPKSFQGLEAGSPSALCLATRS